LKLIIPVENPSCASPCICKGRIDVISESARRVKLIFQKKFKDFTAKAKFIGKTSNSTSPFALGTLPKGRLWVKYPPKNCRCLFEILKTFRKLSSRLTSFYNSNFAIPDRWPFSGVISSPSMRHGFVSVASRNHPSSLNGLMTSPRLCHRRKRPA
jgi:hypothetical protein